MKKIRSADLPEVLRKWLYDRVKTSRLSAFYLQYCTLIRHMQEPGNGETDRTEMRGIMHSKTDGGPRKSLEISGGERKTRVLKDDKRQRGSRCKWMVGGRINHREG